jgi:hypothetical protein
MARPRKRIAFIAWVFVGCSGAQTPISPPGPVSQRPAQEVEPAPVAVTAPVPSALADVAGQFGLTMLGDGWTWSAISRKETRFDWSGRPAAADRQVLYSFWMDKIDATAASLLPQIVSSAAANLSNGEPCRPFEQPADIARVVGVDRVITVCFEPSPFYAKEYRMGVMHGIVQRGSLTIVVVLSNDRAAVIPLADGIGARGAP